MTTLKEQINAVKRYNTFNGAKDSLIKSWKIMSLDAGVSKDVLDNWEKEIKNLLSIPAPTSQPENIFDEQPFNETFIDGLKSVYSVENKENSCWISTFKFDSHENFFTIEQLLQGLANRLMLPVETFKNTRYEVIVARKAFVDDDGSIHYLSQDENSRLCPEWNDVLVVVQFNNQMVIFANEEENFDFSCMTLGIYPVTMIAAADVFNYDDDQ